MCVGRGVIMGCSTAGGVAERGRPAAELEEGGWEGWRHADGVAGALSRPPREGGLGRGEHLQSRGERCNAAGKGALHRARDQQAVVGGWPSGALGWLQDDSAVTAP